ncbi:MAG TPA: HD domain-containing phosphohydrolase, partial [Candidatus Binatia bacterium]|nr:HD domain-containing phosphohydrolase [Candidatus Binatia bacterium]
PEKTCLDYGQAGFLHDYGKQGRHIKHLFSKRKGKYTPEERQLARTHTDVGVLLLDHRLKARLEPEAYKIIKDGILHHHDDYGKHGNNIPMVARIIRVVDHFDAVTHRKRLSMHDAFRELLNHRGTWFDPVVVNVLIKDVLLPTRPRLARLFPTKEEGARINPEVCSAPPKHVKKHRLVLN